MENDRKQIIARRIKELRIDKKITQKELAKQTGLSASSIIGYENGLREPNSKAMAALERFFRVSGEYLRGEVDKITFEKKCNVIDNSLDKVTNLFLVYRDSFGRTSQDKQILSLTVLEESLDFVLNNVCTESDLTFSLDEMKALMKYYILLNDTGREELLKRAFELTQISSYVEMI